MNWASWSGSHETAIDLSGDEVKKLGIAFVGYDLATASDVSATTNIYIDIWSPGISAVKIKLVDFLGDGWTENGDKEYEYTAPISATEQWVTLTIPISTWTSQGVPLTDLNQVIITGVDGNSTGTANYYIDNIYFK